MKDHFNVMSRIKIGQKLVGKPNRLMIGRTIYPPNWNPSSTKSFAEAAIAWRLQNVVVK